jgi:carbon monoxide dehydrogenase subunit G
VIETQASVPIDAPIKEVWGFVQDIRRWAQLFPGCRDCEVIDARNSRWTLKVGAGGLVRTVRVLVRVDEWAGPGRVDFSYTLEGDPVEGAGSYNASPAGTDATDVALTVRVAGTGPLAPLWEAMSRPLLPQLARAFAGRLKAEIERASMPDLQGPAALNTPSARN